MIKVNFYSATCNLKNMGKITKHTAIMDKRKQKPQ